MDVVITNWSLDCYLNLKHANVFSDSEYQKILRPDAELLKLGYPPKAPKFGSSKFWGPAQDLKGHVIQHGFKMKWHNIGNGKVQLRMAVVFLGKYFLCHGYVKENAAKDKREMAKLKNRINNIADGNFNHRGLL